MLFSFWLWKFHCIRNQFSEMKSLIAIQNGLWQTVGIRYNPIAFQRWRKSDAFPMWRCFSTVDLERNGQKFSPKSSEERVIEDWRERERETVFSLCIRDSIGNKKGQYKRRVNFSYRTSFFSHFLSEPIKDKVKKIMINLENELWSIKNTRNRYGKQCKT